MEENVIGILSKYESFTEEEYKNTNCMSYSLFKDVYDHPELLLAPKEDRKEEWLLFGTLVDLILTGDTTDIRVNKFVPTELYKKICDYIIVNNLDINDLTDEQVKNCFEAAESNVNWGIPVKKQKILDNCLNYIYFVIDNKDKIIVSQSLFDEASKLANILLTHEWTKHLFMSKSEQKANNIEIYYQYKIKYLHSGIVFKSKVDIVYIDHTNKLISLYDIKTGSDYPRQFLTNAVYKYKYLYQAALYKIGFEEFIKPIKALEGYSIDDFRFVYISRVDPRFPVILHIPEDMHFSFTNIGIDSDRYYVPSVNEVIHAVKFYLNKIESGSPVVEPYDLLISKGEYSLDEHISNKLSYMV